MTKQEALDKVLHDLSQMTAEEIRTEIDKYSGKDIAMMMKELNNFIDNYSQGEVQ